MKKLMLLIASVACLASCDNKDKQNAAAQRVKQSTLDSVSYAAKQQHVIDSLQDLTNENQAMIPLEEGHKKVTSKRKAPSVNHSPAANTPQTTNTTPGAQSKSNVPANTTVAAAPEKKKGLNNSAKGAIIGLGTGAAAGAIIGKENRGKGAIIGGVAGAIGGAVGGAVLDKRKAKKAAEAARLDSLR